MKQWCVYILRCGDGSFYVGVTNDLEARVATHNSGNGAKYTRGRLPVEVVYREEAADESVAKKREWALKKLTRQAKEKLISFAS